MSKTTDIEIKDWSLGIGPSPHVGFGDMRNLDVYSRPGIIRINNLLEKTSGTTVTDLPLWIVRNPLVSTEIWALGDTQRVYKSTDNGQTWAYVSGNGSGAGQGLHVWKNYLFVTRASTIDVYGPLDSSPSWTTSWQTIDSDNYWHPMITSGNDGKLYGGAGRYVFSLDEVSGSTFNPSNAATYTWTQQALDIPSQYHIKCLAELGEKLMIGTWIPGTTNAFNVKSADILPWDRSSPSYETPIHLEDNGVHSMLTINNILYVLAGVEGRVYSCNGVQATAIAQIPLSVMNIDGGSYVEAFPCSMMKYKGRLFFGVTSQAGIGGAGIYSLVQTKNGNILVNEHSISTGNDGSTNILRIPALLSVSRDVFLAGWQDNTTYGIDSVNNSKRYTSYSAYFESAFYKVGSNLMKRAFQQLEFLLVRALASGHGVKLKYRTKLSDSYTTIGTYDFSTLGPVISHNAIPGIPESEFVQIRGELTTGSGANTTPELRNVILH